MWSIRVPRGRALHDGRVNVTDGDMISTMPGESILPQLPQAGDVIGEKYEVVGVLGRGGMGVVFEAHHKRINQRVALKMLHPHVREEPGVLERFEREARAAGQLRSPHIARVLDVDTATELPFIVMELLDGRDLDDVLAVEGRLAIPVAVDYVLQALVGIREAHSLGIIHRDLKPANLFLSNDGGDAPMIKILDFGISKITTEVDGRLTAAMTTLGSPVYMSPEQLRDGAEIDARADLWALGVVLFELISGKPPHAGTVTGVTASIIADRAPLLSSARADAPPELDAVLARALEKDLDKRFQDADEFAAALLPFASADTARRVQATLVTVPAPLSSRRMLTTHTPQSFDLSQAETRHSFTTASTARPSSRAALWVALGAVAFGSLLGVTIFMIARRPASASAQPAAPTAVVATASPGAAATNAEAAPPEAAGSAALATPEPTEAKPAQAAPAKPVVRSKPRRGAPPATAAPAGAKNPLRL